MDFKDTFFSRNLSINCRGSLIDLSNPVIMAILNMTPDSFFDGGKYTNSSVLKERIKSIVEEGADILDIGGFSSRPGSAEVSIKEELERLKPAFEIIRTEYPELLVSIDTYRAEVARTLHETYQIDIINDITGGEKNPDLLLFSKENNLPYIIMHMQGTPETMQKKPEYKDVVNEILNYFNQKVEYFRESGIKDIIIDPGFGFGKTTAHNYEILRNLDTLNLLELPVMVGISRKSMIYKTLNNTPDEALNGTTVLHTLALINGASLLRVHDVKEAREAIELVRAYKGNVILSN